MARLEADDQISRIARHEPLRLSEAKGVNPNNGLFNPLINNIYMVPGYNAYNSAIMAINGLVMVLSGYWIRYRWSNPLMTHWSGVQSLPGYSVLVQYGHVHTDARNRMSKQRAKKLAKIYFNGRTVEKALKLDWVSQAFLWDESEPVADTNE